jgi:heme-degrading monooxygenase HmoA
MSEADRPHNFTEPDREPPDSQPRSGLVIGPTEGGPDVQVVPTRPRRASRARSAPATDSRPRRRRGESRGPEYARVNIWKLNDIGAAWDDTAARMIAAELERQPGFRSYTLVRTGEWEVVSVTVFDSEGELRAAIDSIAEFARRHVAPFVEPDPDRHEGTVLCHVMA